MYLRSVNNEVYYLESKIKVENKEFFDFLFNKSEVNPRRRCRICFHANEQSDMHEMLIMLRKGSYVPVHKHLHSDESSLILHGEGALIFFDEEGQVTSVECLDAQGVKGSRFIRLAAGQLHSLYISTDIFYFKETICGPFDRKNYVQPEWTPDESDKMAVSAFLERAADLYKKALKNENES
jgi:cupin fold WbuC family metalloprotein